MSQYKFKLLYGKTIIKLIIWNIISYIVLSFILFDFNFINWILYKDLVGRVILIGIEIAIIFFSLSEKLVDE